MAFETTGDGGSNNAPLGTVASEQTPTQIEAPAPIDVNDDSLINIKGSNKPVKFGEHVKGFQAEFTKASQRAAQLERDLAQERESRARYERERQTAAQQPTQGQKPDVFAALRELPYLSGEQAVEALQGITQQIQDRDRVLVAAITKMQQFEKILGTLNESHSTNAFDTKVNKWVTEAGFDPQSPGAIDIAKEIYLAYEGRDLDQEFPRIFTERMKQLEELFEAKKRAALNNGRRQPFVPGRGGTTGPSAPLQVKPNASSRELAEQLFGSWNGPGT